MEFPKTKVVPSNDPIAASKLFQQMLAEPFILLVVLGDGQSAEDLVSKASSLTGLANEPRWVIWARQPSDLSADIKQLKESTPGLKNQIASGSVAAFTTSLKDEVCDVVLTSETADNARIELAYVNAEAA
jgi:hypothetical protein